MRIVSYIRVSTARQGASGLGLEGQTAAIKAFAKSRKATITKTFTEVESGRNNDRPELAKAIKEARLTGSTLVIARLDRLGRNAAFLMKLRDSGVDFVCADMPEANAMTVGMMALVAEYEANVLSERIKAALRATKERGTVLGNPNGAAALRRAQRGNTDAVKTIKKRADARAHDLAETLADLEQSGFKTLQQQADELNRRGIRTARQKRWHPSSVSNLRKRLDAS
ncbi:resolvase [Roseovarius sp. HI0049]|nr:resolvase [Roseovarius sp. HI0049]